MNLESIRMVIIPLVCWSPDSEKSTALLGKPVGLWRGFMRSGRTGENSYSKIFMLCLILSWVPSSGGLMVKTGWFTQAVDTGTVHKFSGSYFYPAGDGKRQC